MTAPTRPVLRYHGGKWKLAPWIIGNLPAHRVYVEPYGGAASVLMQKPRSYAEIYNDKWGVVVNVFRVLRDPEQAAELERQLRLTPFARDEFELTGNAELAELLPIESARRTILRSFAGFGSGATNAEHATGFRANSNRSGTTPAHDWAHFPRHIKQFTERLQGVVIENREAAAVMLAHDGLQTLHYVDPPYPPGTRYLDAGDKSYAVDMTDDDHRIMAGVLRQLRGMVVLSGYACDLYDVELFADWERISRPAFADGARARTEVMWLNGPARMASLPLFSQAT